MATFKVVLDGIDLTPEQSFNISQSVQRAVMHELANLGRGKDDASPGLEFALLPIFKGQTKGLIAVPPDILGGRALEGLLAKEFGR